MSRALLEFNPDVQSHSGDVLLFGIALPQPIHVPGLSALEELNLASHFLEAHSAPALASLIEYVVSRAGTEGGRPIGPRASAALWERLTRAAAVIRHALRPDIVGGSALSAEAIFGSEFEGLSPEDQEFETAHRFIRLASEMSRAVACRGRGVPPDLLAAQAECRFAPGLARALALLTARFNTRYPGR
jgi:hypothetical protein